MKKLFAILLPVALAIGCVTSAGMGSMYAKETKNLEFDFPLYDLPEDYDDDYVEGLAKRYGFDSIKIDENGIANVTMSEEKAKEFADEVEQQFIELAKQEVDCEQNNVTRITFDLDKFENFEVYTLNEILSDGEKELLENIEQTIQLVHKIRNIKNYKYEIVMRNSNTNKVLGRIASEM